MCPRDVKVSDASICRVPALDVVVPDSGELIMTFSASLPGAVSDEPLTMLSSDKVSTARSADWARYKGIFPKKPATSAVCSFRGKLTFPYCLRLMVTQSG